MDGAMILPQEVEQTVTFDARSLYSGSSPWFERLFVLYLAFMLVVLLARAQQIGWELARLRRFQRRGISEVQHFRAVWCVANAHADSLRRFSVLTFVLVMADFCMAAADIVARMATQKSESTSWLSIDASPKLQISAFGFLVCAALYAASFFFHGRLARRERSFEREQAKEKGSGAV